MVSRWQSDCPSYCPSVHVSQIRSSLFSFPDDNLSKCNKCFSKRDVCIDIVDICFGIANGQMSLCLTVICLRHIRTFISFHITLLNIKRISLSFVCALILSRSS